MSGRVNRKIKLPHAPILVLSEGDLLSLGLLDVDMVLEKVRIALQLDDARCEKLALYIDDDSEHKFSAMLAVAKPYALFKCIMSRSKYEEMLPRSRSMLVLARYSDAVPLALMDGTLLSSLRTGAVAAIALRKCKRATRVGIVGSGAISKASLFLMAGACQVTEVSILSRSCLDRRQAYEALFPDIRIRWEESAEQFDGACDFQVLASGLGHVAPVTGKSSLCQVDLGGECSNAEFVRACARNRRLFADSARGVVARRNHAVGKLVHDSVLEEQDIRPFAELTAIDQPTVVTTVGLASTDLLVAAHLYEKAGNGSQPLEYDPHWLSK